MSKLTHVSLIINTNNIGETFYISHKPKYSNIIFNILHNNANVNKYTIKFIVVY